MYIGYNIPWDLRRRGLKDSIRHDERVKEAIRENLKDLIAEESIITSNGGKKIKVPIRYLDQYHFRYGKNDDSGVGQGEGQEGDVVGRKSQEGSGQGQPGDKPGEDVYEAEITVDELVKMMLEDLNLPWLDEKDRQKKIKSMTTHFNDIRQKGLIANLDKKRTLLNNLKRNAARGYSSVGGFHETDMRFKVEQEVEDFDSQAAVYLMMDRSGSMDTERKYIAKSFFFWMVQFLRLKYDQVDLVFVAHDTEAKIVEEEDFFKISNSGGTKCSSAYQLALETIPERHPASKFNNYVFHFSDGDNWGDDNQKCMTLIKDLLPMTRMIGYGEISYHSYHFYYGGGDDAKWSSMYRTLGQIEDSHFLRVAIQERSDIYKALQQFLGKGDSQHESKV